MIPAGTRAFICGCEGTSLSAAERDFITRAKPFGLILFARNIDNPDQVRALIAEFRRLVGSAHAPVFIDQEGGRVQRLRPPHWRAYPPGSAYGALYARDPLAAFKAARAVNWLLADELMALGINADCLPVLDVPVEGSHEIIGDRAYARDPQVAALLARAASAGLAAAGVATVIKHIPGHGRARADSHKELPVVDATLEELRAHDFLPFAALADAPMAMTAHVVYTALDASAPATTSRTVIEEVIRGELGFNGLLMSDDLNMEALSGSLAARAQAVFAAGCDLALHCSGKLAEMEEVAAHAPVLSGAALRRAQAACALMNRPIGLPPAREEAQTWRERLLALA